jgi:integrase
LIRRRKKDCPPGEPRWVFVGPKSRPGIRAVELPALLAPFVAAHLAALDGAPNPLDLVFPSETDTPLDRRNVRRRHFVPATKALGITGVRPHDLRRTFVYVHVQAGTHPKVVQEQAGRGSFGLTMDVYGRIAGKMQLCAEEKARLDGLATKTVPGDTFEKTAQVNAKSSARKLRLKGRQLRQPALAKEQGPPDGGGV